MGRYIVFETQLMMIFMLVQQLNHSRKEWDGIEADRTKRKNNTIKYIKK